MTEVIIATETLRQIRQQMNGMYQQLLQQQKIKQQQKATQRQTINY